MNKILLSGGGNPLSKQFMLLNALLMFTLVVFKFYVVLNEWPIIN